MKRNTTGRYEVTVAGGEQVKAFIPDPLPPDPEIVFDRRLVEKLSQASLALGRLDSLSLFPDLNLFLYQYVRREAVLSSQIEGTQSTLDDLLTFEDGDAPGVPFDDVIEVSNYVAALEYGFNRLFKDDFPLSLRLIKEMHEKLLSSGRGSEKTPGEFKRSQNWLGGDRPTNAAFVPTPPHETLTAMGALESFLHDRTHAFPPLIVAGLAHVQFETIHPFLDGNGRLGRMLIPLILCERGVLREPSLYLSLFFKANRAAYYGRLQHVREDGDWEGWLEFFLEGVAVTATNAVDTARQMNMVYQRDREKLLSAGKATSGIMRTHECMFGRISANAARIAAVTELSPPTINTALQTLADFGIVRETTGKQRGKRYLYGEVHAALSSELGDFVQQRGTVFR
ncbi:MAG: Fic family protein [Desulfovibrionaceae bacterium]